MPGRAEPCGGAGRGEPGGGGGGGSVRLPVPPPVGVRHGLELRGGFVGGGRRGGVGFGPQRQQNQDQEETLRLPEGEAVPGLGAAAQRPHVGGQPHGERGPQRGPSRPLSRGHPPPGPGPPQPLGTGPSSPSVGVFSLSERPRPPPRIGPFPLCPSDGAFSRPTLTGDPGSVPHTHFPPKS